MDLGSVPRPLSLPTPCTCAPPYSTLHAPHRRLIKTYLGFHNSAPHHYWGLYFFKTWALRRKCQLGHVMQRSVHFDLGRHAPRARMLTKAAAWVHGQHAQIAASAAATSLCQRLLSPHPNPHPTPNPNPNPSPNPNPNPNPDQEYGITREVSDGYAISSQQKWAAAL